MELHSLSGVTNISEEYSSSNCEETTGGAVFLIVLLASAKNMYTANK